MDNRLLQEGLAEYSFLELAKKLIPKTMFPIVTYKYSNIYKLPGCEKMREQLIPRFHCVTRQEVNDILSGKWNSKRNYEHLEMKYGFYFIDAPLGDLRKYFSDWFANPYIEEILKPFYTEEDGKVYFSKKMLCVAVFVILHEYGHYLDYIKFPDKEKYVKWVNESKAPLRAFDEEIQHLYERGNFTEEKYRLRDKIYRECEDEHSADMYAFENLNNKMEEALDIIFG